MRQKVCCFTKRPVSDLDPNEWLARIEGAIENPLLDVKSDGMKRTVKVHMSPWGELCLQEFKLGLRRKLLSPFRLSRGMRIWVYSSRLLQRGILIPEPLLLSEVRLGVFVTRIYVVTRWIREKVDLRRLILGSGKSGDLELLAALSQAVDMSAALHNEGFLHGDLKWSNFFLLLDGSQRVMLTDLDGLRKSSNIFRQGRDFARFVLSGIEYQVDRDLINSLIDRYLSARTCSRIVLKWSLRWHTARKRVRYEGRSFSHLA
jgi:tRNA A-37 threonylcarbamoyl transferase component Bud32